MSYKQLHNDFVHVQIDTDKGTVRCIEKVSTSRSGATALRSCVVTTDSIRIIQNLYRDSGKNLGYQTTYGDVMQWLISYMPSGWVKTEAGIYPPIKRGDCVIGHWGAGIADSDGIVKKVSGSIVTIKWLGHRLQGVYTTDNIRRGGFDIRKPIGVYLVEGD